MVEQDSDNSSGRELSAAADSWPLTARDAAALIGVNERTIRRAIARGDLIATRHAGVYRIAHADLERYRTDDRSKAVSAPAPRSRLPHPLTTLIGRESELRELGRLLQAGARMVTLTGPGGAGKTRLAIEIARNHEAGFPGGVCFVPLDTVPEASIVPPMVAAALDVRFDPARAAASIAAALHDQRTLLVLDNLEHLTGAAPFLAELLDRSPALHLLVTSQTLLRVPGEQAFIVGPLEIDSEAGAARLFAERAAALAPGFALTETTTPVVIEICRLLDGLPLAIELAAARMSHLPLESLRDRLEHRLPLLTNRAAGPVRHRTLRAAIGWSYDLLAPDEQRALRLFEVFNGGFTLETAEGLMSEIDGANQSAVDLIASLVDASLLVHERSPGQRSRYRMLETIREFAAEERAAHGEEAESRRAHAAVFLAFAEPRTPEPFLTDNGPLLAELSAEDANLRQCLVWLEANGQPDEFARLVATLGSYLTARGHPYDGHHWFEIALSRLDAGAPDVRARIALAYSVSLLTRGNAGAARQRAADAVALMDVAGNKIFATRALIVLGAAATADQDYSAAIEALETSLKQAADAEDARVATGLEAAALANLGMVRLELGELDASAKSYKAALEKLRAIGNVPTTALTLIALGDIARVRGDFSKALDWLQAGMTLAQESRNTRAIVEGLDSLTRTLISIDPGSQTAIRLYAAADRLREQTGMVRMTGAKQRWHRELLARIGSELDGPAWQAGRRLSLEQAVSEVVEFAAESGSSQRNPLTRREMDVLQQLAAGKQDREIAETLFVSVRTVEHHVANILAKLAVPSRTAAVSTALTSGLVRIEPPPAPE